MPDAQNTIQGKCLCGVVEFEATLPAKFCVHCHCSMCRRGSGAPFVTWAGFPTEALRIVKGEAHLVRRQSSPGGARSFCQACGSQLFCDNEHLPGIIDVTRASLADDAALEPTMHVYYSDKAPWVEAHDGLPRRGGPTGTEPLD